MAHLENENGSGHGWQAAIAAVTRQCAVVAMHMSPVAVVCILATQVLSIGTTTVVGLSRHVVTLPRKMFAETDHEVNRSVPASACWFVSEARRLTMKDEHVPTAEKPSSRIPWNKGKLVGAKPPLKPSHAWSIRTKMQIEGKKRDLALFNLAIDSKLRGCDVVAIRVDDVAPSGYAMDRATIRQKKTGRPVRFEVTDQARLAIDDYLRLTGRKPGQFLFAGRGDKGGLTTRQYARLVQEWVASIGLDPTKFGTHSLRRTRAVLIYRRTGNLRAVQILLSHTPYCPRTAG